MFIVSRSLPTNFYSAGDACDPVLCFYSLACRCSPVMLQSPLMECNKTTNVFVEGKSVTVTYYTYVTPGRNGIILYLAIHIILDLAIPD